MENQLPKQEGKLDREFNAPSIFSVFSCRN